MIDLHPLANTPKPLAVLGLGVTGLAVARAAKAAGVFFHAWDDNADRRAAHKDDFEIVDFSDDLSGYAALVPAPGIKPVHPVLQRAAAQRISVISDMDLLCRAAPHARVIGVTGTNGKSTTTALIAHILKSAGRKAEAGGNIGRAACDLPMLGADGIYVLELSSYQLAITADGVCDIAVILNLTPDHLDWHPDFDDYAAAKKRITRLRADRPQQTTIIGVDMPATQNIADDMASAPAHCIVTLSTRKKADIHVQGGLLFDGETQIADLAAHEFLKGAHNFENMAAAFAACRAAGLTADKIVAGLFTFEGLPHRQKKVAQWRHIAFVNDSKATNADATAHALSSFDNIYWIAGGLPKTDGIDGLEIFYPKIRHAFLIGEAEKRFAAKLDGHLPYTRCGDMAHAIGEAFKAAQKDDKQAVILLSPACASFDQYKNFEERGDHFTALVGDLLAQVAA